MYTFRPSNNLGVSLDSIILVTGVSSMIATHIADEALKAGFRVRGTVRSKQKGEEVAKLLNSPNFEFIIVQDMAAERAFDEAMHGVSAAIHCASVVTFSGIVEEVITPTVKGVKNILEAALENPSVKSVVYTSTSSTATRPRPGVKFHVDRNTWNQDAVDMVKNTTLEMRAEMGFEWDYMVYVVSKIEAERATWAFVEQRKPPFRVNVTNPAMNWGKVIGSISISVGQVMSVLDGKVPPIPSIYMVDTIDDARINLAAAVDATVASERIFVCDSPFNWTLVIEALQKALPDAQLPEPDPNELLDISTIDNVLGAKLLKKWWGQPGYKGLERTINETLEMCLERKDGYYKRRPITQ